MVSVAESTQCEMPRFGMSLVLPEELRRAEAVPQVLGCPSPGPAPGDPPHLQSSQDAVFRFPLEGATITAHKFVLGLTSEVFQVVPY